LRLQSPPWCTLFPYTTLFRSPLRKWISSCWAARGLASSPTSKAVATLCLEIHRIGRIAEALMGSNPITSTLALTLDSADSKADVDRKSTRLNSSHDQISYAVF